jgi:hypothetical protein
MSQIIHDISTPNDGLGDELRTAFDHQNQMNTDLYTNKVDKELGKGLSTNDYTNDEKTKLAGIEEGAQVNVPINWDDIIGKPEDSELFASVGHFHIGNSLSAQSITSGVQTKLLNDGEGVFSTDIFRPYGIANIWNATDSQFDFSDFDLGDQLALRIDLLLDTASTNTDVRVYINFGIGTPSEYKLMVCQKTYKNTVSNFPVTEELHFSIDNEDWRDAPAEVLVLTDGNATILVNGWYVPILRKSINVVDLSGGDYLSDDISTYASATTPLAGTEIALVEQGGTFKKVAVSEFGGGGSSETFAQSKWMFNDFYSANNPLNREPFMGAAVNGGSFNLLNTATLPEHQGYGVIASGTNANGGFRQITNNSGIRVQTGLTGIGIISLNPDSSARDRVIRYGFHDTVNQNAPSNGVYVEILGSDLTFKATASSVTSASSTITLANGINDLYEIMIYCTSGSDVRCIVNKIGTGVVLDTNLTTNIPTAGLNNGIVATITTAGSNNNICQVDYMGLGAVCPTFLQDRL